MHAVETAVSLLGRREECGAQEACIALHSGGGVQSIATASSFVILSQRRYFAMLNGLAAVPDRYSVRHRRFDVLGMRLRDINAKHCRLQSKKSSTAPLLWTISSICHYSFKCVRCCSSRGSRFHQTQYNLHIMVDGIVRERGELWGFVVKGRRFRGVEFIML